jgi:hypothetical protein
MARPTKYNAEKATQICDALKIGATRKAAVRHAGIDYQTFLNWLGRYSSFSSEVASSEAMAELRFTSTLAAAAQGSEGKPGDWRPALEWLKRRRREEWGDHIRQEVTGDASRPLTVKILNGVTMDDL